jgi:exopolysaccharide biosynthesis polyprenyl glycosylphosphotransferase
MLPVIVLWIVCFYTGGHYSLEMPFSGYKTVWRIFIVALISTLVGFAIYYLNYESQIVPKTILILFSLLAFILISSWRWLLNTISKKYFPGVNIVFIGINSMVTDLLHRSSVFSYMAYNVPFIFDDTYEGEYYLGIPVFKEKESFIGEIKKNNIKAIVLAYDKNISYILQDILFELLHRHVYFLNIADFYETYIRLIPIDAVNELWFLQRIDLSIKSLYQYVKRAVDIVMAMLMLICTLPFLPLVILSIKTESPGPAFFRQKRVGLFGKEFSILKFRTMQTVGNSYEPTAKDDPRITKFGSFLRKTRIDEIPQCVNVLKGDMSFIGPRPERPELVCELEKEIPFYRQRLLVKPGLSGWDQVSGEYHSPSIEDTAKKLQYDLYYIKNMSLFLDISIFFKTLVTVVKRAGV